MGGKHQSNRKNALRRRLHVAGEGPIIDLPPVDYFDDAPKKKKPAVTLAKVRFLEEEKVSNADIK